MLWLNESREKIKKDNPGITVTEIAKKGGELWRELTDKSVRIVFFYFKRKSKEACNGISMDTYSPLERP